jgi:acetyltransferase-like isoleucine patch superfamily enzyme
MGIYTYLQQQKEFYIKRIYKYTVKWFFKEFGKGVRIDYRVKINNPENIEIGDFVSINWGVNLIAPNGIKIGDHFSNGFKIYLMWTGI